MKKEIPDIVLRAMIKPIVDIGQITKQDRYHLNKYVKKGILCKGHGGCFPNEKMVYALIGHDIKQDRIDGVKELFRMIKLLEPQNIIHAPFLN